MMSRIALILLLLASLPLRANLGETVAQCVVRYGKPVAFTEANPKCPFGTMVFVDGGYTLLIFLLETTEVGARVSKKDKSAFADAELQTIMGADSEGAGWTTAPSSDPTCLRWTRGDKATVLYDKSNHVLIFTAPEMAQALEKAKAANAAAEAAGTTTTPATPVASPAPPSTPAP